MTNRIPETVIEEIRQANDIVDVIGDYVQLKKQGRNFVGLCPFHGEKTPSFSVTQEKQIFRCFGCGKGGNVVSFLMEMESYSFYEALQHLAERSGKELPDTGVKKESSLSQESQSILSAYEWVTKLYHHLLRYAKDGKEGYQYLQDRGLEEDTIDAFHLGFAPNAKDFTAEFLEKKGFHRQILVKAGLVSLLNDNSVSDRFRGRVIFPIRNHLGKTVAFGGRALGEDQEPKYLNSPESDLFQKGKLLFNFDLARKYIRKEGQVILFEGYMDVISAFQAEVRNVVATMGTALTEYQAKLLKRYVDTVIICYDGDNAGVEATSKAADLLRTVGCDVKVARIKDGLDPDSFIQTYGKEAFQNEVIKASETFIAFYMRYHRKAYNLNLEGDRIKYIEKMLEQLAMIDSPVEREYYVKELSKEFDISMDTLIGELENYQNRNKKQQDKSEKNRYTNSSSAPVRNKKLLPAFQNAEKKLISYMLQDATIAEKVREELGAAFNVDEHKIIATHLYAFYEDGHSADVSLFIERLTDQKLNQIVIEIAMTPVIDDISDKEINDYIKVIRAQANDVTDIQSLKSQQRMAERQNDPIKAAQIAKQIIEIQKQLKNTN
ncbi:DNA primase [Oceanobacillus kapialis]|uniref:DNA primase n=1 Tax=Oceanobacillus kapialis TaxID=481353 RepID=A0ABW5Q5D3_9BACI